MLTDSTILGQRFSQNDTSTRINYIDINTLSIIQSLNSDVPLTSNGLLVRLF